MRSGKYKIKQYKTGRSRRWIIWLLAAAGIAVLALHLIDRRALTLPAFTAPALTQADMQQETRVLTLEGSHFFALQLGAFDDEKSARQLADSFRSRGAAGYLYKNGNYRVLAAAYESRESAQAVQAQLAQIHGVDAYLCPLNRSGITLRLTGQKAQLDALSDIFDLCDQLTYTLCSISQALDKGEITADEARQALSSQRDTVHSLSSRMNMLFSREHHEAIAQLSSLLSDMENHLASAAATTHTVQLGSSIKFCHLYLLCSLEAYIGALSP